MVSIRAIVVNYKSAAETLEAARALLASSGVDIKVSIIDNSSEDSRLNGDMLNTAAANNARIEVIEMSDNVGFGAANNVVLENLERYPEAFFAIINPDSVVEPNALDVITQAMVEYNAAMAGGLVLGEDGRIQTTCFRTIPNLTTSMIHSLNLNKIIPSLKNTTINRDASAFPTSVTEAEAISGAFMVVTRQLIADMGAFDPQYFMHVEDLDWCQRMNLAGKAILFVPDARLMHKKGVSSASRPLRVQWYLHHSMWLFYRKYQAENHNVLQQGAIASLISARFIVVSLLSMVRRA